MSVFFFVFVGGGIMCELFSKIFFDICTNVTLVLVHDPVEKLIDNRILMSSIFSDSPVFCLSFFFFGSWWRLVCDYDLQASSSFANRVTIVQVESRLFLCRGWGKGGLASGQ